MKVNLILFLLTLVLTVCFQVNAYTPLSETGNSLLRSEPFVRSDERYVQLPLDVLPFSASVLHHKLGCMVSGVKYIGFSGKPGGKFAIIQGQGVENIFTPGDSIFAPDDKRIIWIDPQHLILRNTSSIAVLCREDTDKHPAISAAKPAAISKAEPLASDIVVTPSHFSAPVASSTAPVKSVPTEETSEVRPKPATSGVTGSGYRIKNCRSYCWLLHMVSLQEGDVIQTIQGRPVRELNRSQLSHLIEDNRQGITLTLVRDGHPLTQTIPGNVLSSLLAFVSPEAKS